MKYVQCKFPVVDDVRGRHMAPRFIKLRLPRVFCVNALVALKAEFILWNLRMPGVPPAGSGPLAEAQRRELLHERHKGTQF